MLVVLLTSCLAFLFPPWFSDSSAEPLSCTAGLETTKAVEVLSGKASINGIPARYSVFSSDSGFGLIEEAALSSGWREIARDSNLDFETDAHVYEVRFYKRSGETLIMAIPRGESGLLLAGVFEGDFPRPAESGDVPGREPAGVPRPGGCRRLLHVSAENWEAAWYSSAAPVEKVLHDEARRMSTAGWKVKEVAGLVTASREGRPQVTVSSGAGEGEACFIILATGGKM